jgi:hypothetical protein
MRKRGEMTFHLQPKAATLIDFDQWLDSRYGGDIGGSRFHSSANRQRSKMKKGREEIPKIAVERPKNIQHYTNNHL